MAGAMTFTADRASLALQRKGCNKDFFLGPQFPLLASLKQKPERKVQVKFIKFSFVGPGYRTEGYSKGLKEAISSVGSPHSSNSFGTGEDTASLSQGCWFLWLAKQITPKERYKARVHCVEFWQLEVQTQGVGWTLMP